MPLAWLLVYSNQLWKVNDVSGIATKWREMREPAVYFVRFQKLSLGSAHGGYTYLQRHEGTIGYHVKPEPKARCTYWYTPVDDSQTPEKGEVLYAKSQMLVKIRFCAQIQARNCESLSPR